MKLCLDNINYLKVSFWLYETLLLMHLKITDKVNGIFGETKGVEIMESVWQKNPLQEAGQLSDRRVFSCCLHYSRVPTSILCRPSACMDSP